MAPFRQPIKIQGIWTFASGALGATVTVDIGQPSEKVRSARSATVPLLNRFKGLVDQLIRTLRNKTHPTMLKILASPSRETVTNLGAPETSS